MTKVKSVPCAFNGKSDKITPPDGGDRDRKEPGRRRSGHPSGVVHGPTRNTEVGMTNRHEILAAEVVDAFKNSLDEETLSGLSQTQLDTLAQLVEEALSDELQITIERIEELAHDLRTQLEHKEIEL